MTRPAPTRPLGSSLSRTSPVACKTPATSYSSLKHQLLQSNIPSPATSSPRAQEPAASSRLCCQTNWRFLALVNRIAPLHGWWSPWSQESFFCSLAIKSQVELMLGVGSSFGGQKGERVSALFLGFLIQREENLWRAERGWGRSWKIWFLWIKRKGRAGT